MIAIVSANNNATIIAGKILGAADGLRPKALIEAYPITATTIEGPRIAANKTKNIIKLRNIGKIGTHPFFNIL